MPKIIISGGGTGGHIYPAIAIANAIKNIVPDAEILFVGAEGKMEMEKVPKAGFKIIGLPIAGIIRSLTIKNLWFPFKLVKSLVKARNIVRVFRPDVAVGVGGYASGPLLLAASWAGVPYLIQEQNSFAGITNKFLGRKAKKICVAYPDMERFFPAERLLVTGNPVRKDIIAIAHKRPHALQYFGLQDQPILLVIGGSQGAKTINEAIDNLLPELLEQGIQLIWQTGKPYIDNANARIAQLNAQQQVWVSDFIYEMDLVYAAADVVVSRAGALSVSELCLAAKPAILVPLPSAAEDHQTQNAMSLVKHKAAVLVPDTEIKEKLLPAILELFQHTMLRQELCQNIHQLAQPHAADIIAKEVLALAMPKE